MLILPLANWICIALNKRLYCVFLLFSLRSLRMKSPPQCCQDISTEEYEKKKGPKRQKSSAEHSSEWKCTENKAAGIKHFGLWFRKMKKNSSVQYFHWWSNWRGNWFSNLNKAPDLWSFCHNIDENISPLWWFMFMGNKNIKYSVK